MGRTRKRHSNAREVVIGMIGPLAMAVALGIAIIWMQRPVRLEVAVSGAQAQGSPSSDRAAPASMPRPERDPAYVAVAAVPDAGVARSGGGSVGAFRTVCCRRSDNTTYWTAAEWCDDVGSAVDDRMCGVVLPEPSVTAGVAAEVTADVPPPMTYTQCLRMAGTDSLKARFDARCSLLLETVCCEQKGHVGETARGECQEVSHSREVDPRMCEPVCCHRPSLPSILWDNRGNCGDVTDRLAMVVSEDKCEEVCCQMPDRTMKRDGRRACAARGGTSRATSTCGTSVTVDGRGQVDADRLRMMDEVSNRVDVELDHRLPMASPFL